MEKHKINLVERGKMLFPEATFQETKAEKETNYYGAHFGIRALEYLVFVGTLLTLGLFAGAVFQLMKNPSVGFYCLMAGILIGTMILLHLFVKQRLIDAMATGIGHRSAIGDRRSARHDAAAAPPRPHHESHLEHALFAERLQRLDMQRRRTRTCIQLGANRGNAEAGQRKPFAPAQGRALDDRLR